MRLAVGGMEILDEFSDIIQIIFDYFVLIGISQAGSAFRQIVDDAPEFLVISLPDDLVCFIEHALRINIQQIRFCSFFSLFLLVFKGFCVNPGHFGSFLNGRDLWSL